MTIYRITAELVEGIVEQYGDLRALNLSNNRISRLESLEPLSSLTRLNVSSNRLQSLDGLRLPNLRTLHASRNLISRLGSDVAAHSQLQALDLGSNLLADLGAALDVLSRLRSLRHLTMVGNPLASVPGYGAAVRRAMPWLVTLDGLPIAEFSDDSSPAASAERPRSVSTPAAPPPDATPPRAYGTPRAALPATPPATGGSVYFTPAASEPPSRTEASAYFGHSATGTPRTVAATPQSPPRNQRWYHTPQAGPDLSSPSPQPPARTHASVAAAPDDSSALTNVQAALRQLQGRVAAMETAASPARAPAAADVARQASPRGHDALPQRAAERAARDQAVQSGALDASSLDDGDRGDASYLSAESAMGAQVRAWEGRVAAAEQRFAALEERMRGQGDENAALRRQLAEWVQRGADMALQVQQLRSQLVDQAQDIVRLERGEREPAALSGSHDAGDASPGTSAGTATVPAADLSRWSLASSSSRVSAPEDDDDGASDTSVAVPGQESPQHGSSPLAAPTEALEAVTPVTVRGGDAGEGPVRADHAEAGPSGVGDAAHSPDLDGSLDVSDVSTAPTSGPPLGQRANSGRSTGRRRARVVTSSTPLWTSARTQPARPPQPQPTVQWSPVGTSSSDEQDDRHDLDDPPRARAPRAGAGAGAEQSMRRRPGTRLEVQLQRARRELAAERARALALEGALWELHGRRMNARRQSAGRSVSPPPAQGVFDPGDGILHAEPSELSLDVHVRGSSGAPTLRTATRRLSGRLGRSRTSGAEAAATGPFPAPETTELGVHRSQESVGEGRASAATSALQQSEAGGANTPPYTPQRGGSTPRQFTFGDALARTSVGRMNTHSMDLSTHSAQAPALQADSATTLNSPHVSASPQRTRAAGPLRTMGFSGMSASQSPTRGVVAPGYAPGGVSGPADIDRAGSMRTEFVSDAEATALDEDVASSHPEQDVASTASDDHSAANDWGDEPETPPADSPPDHDEQFLSTRPAAAVAAAVEDVQEEISALREGLEAASLGRIRDRAVYQHREAELTGQVEAMAAALREARAAAQNAQASARLAEERALLAEERLQARETAAMLDASVETAGLAEDDAGGAEAEEAEEIAEADEVQEGADVEGGEVVGEEEEGGAGLKEVSAGVEEGMVEAEEEAAEVEGSVEQGSPVQASDAPAEAAAASPRSAGQADEQGGAGDEDGGAVQETGSERDADQPAASIADAHVPPPREERRRLDDGAGPSTGHVHVAATLDPDLVAVLVAQIEEVEGDVSQLQALLQEQLARPCRACGAVPGPRGLAGAAPLARPTGAPRAPDRGSEPGALPLLLAAAWALDRARATQELEDLAAAGLAAEQAGMSAAAEAKSLREAHAEATDAIQELLDERDRALGAHRESARQADVLESRCRALADELEASRARVAEAEAARDAAEARAEALAEASRRAAEATEAATGGLRQIQERARAAEQRAAGLEGELGVAREREGGARAEARTLREALTRSQGAAERLTSEAEARFERALAPLRRRLQFAEARAAALVPMVTGGYAPHHGARGGDLADLELPAEVAAEIAALRDERESLVARLAREVRTRRADDAEARIAAARSEARASMQAVRDELADARERLLQATRRVEDAESARRAAEVAGERSARECKRLREEVEAAREAERAAHDGLERAVRDAETRSAEEVRSLRGQLDAAKRQAGRAEAQLAAAEREAESARASASAENEALAGVLASKLRARDAAIRALREERATLLATLKERVATAGWAGGAKRGGAEDGDVPRRGGVPARVCEPGAIETLPAARALPSEYDGEAQREAPGAGARGDASPSHHHLLEQRVVSLTRLSMGLL